MWCRGGIMIIPPRGNITSSAVGVRSSCGDNECAFGIETNLADTPAMDRLWEYILKSKEEDIIHKNLAGNISRSLHLDDTDDWFLDNVLISLIKEYKDEYPERFENLSLTLSGSDTNVFSGNEKAPFALSTFWVNFQNQHEFNPVHHHSGIFSFNIFIKIPYDWKEQYELPHIKASNSPSAGNFEFLYTDVLGKINGYVYRLDPTCEGLMLLFPAEMRHLVYPFYNCEEERITVSGNIVYDI
jgi:hypothetical protein